MSEIFLVLLGVASGGWIGLGQLSLPRSLVWGLVAAVGFAAAGATSPWPTRTAATWRRREFVAFAGVLAGVVGAMLVSGAAVLAGLGAVALRFAAPAFARRGLAGEAILAGLAGFPLMFGALAVGQPLAGIVPWILVSWLGVVNGLVSRQENSLAAGLALAFVPVSLVLPARSGYGAPYFLVGLFAQLAVLAVGTRLLVGRKDRLTPLLTGARVVGMIALVAGRIG